MPTYTNRHVNMALGSAIFRGTYETIEAATLAAERDTRDTRSFFSVEVWTGTPRAPYRETGIVRSTDHAKVKG